MVNQKPEYRIFRNIENPSLYRIIYPFTSVWNDIKIYELKYANFQTQIECIAQDPEMRINCIGRKIFYETAFSLLPEWNEVDLDILSCVKCKHTTCSSDCLTLNEFLR